MMRGIRRLAVGVAMTGLLAGGAVGAAMGTAHAAEVGYCLGTSSNSYSCTLMGTIASPAAVTVTVADDVSGASEEVTADVTTLSCTDSTGTASEPASSSTGDTTLTDNVLPLPATADGTCDVTATVSLAAADASTKGFTASEFTASLTYTAAASPTPTASAAPVHPVKGYDGKCVSDKGNSSANRTAIILWTCSGTDQALSWKYSDGEFIHTGKCLNDQANGGSRSKVILWACNGGANEKWSELANGELKLKSHNGTLCLDDPAYSTKNGTQLIVYTCKDSANQKWSLP
jgi:Ricin-type beta-trefoil lectin domain